MKRVISVVLISLFVSLIQVMPTANATAPGKPIIGGATCNTYTAIWSFTMTSTTAVTGFKYAFTTHLVDTAPTIFYDFAGSFTQSGDSYTITFNSRDYVTAGKTTGEQARPWIKGVSGSDVGEVNNVRYLSCPVTLETPNAATKIVLTRQAGGGATGLAFTTQPQLTLQDASSNTVTGSTPVITATVTTSGDQKERYLVGTTTATIVSGTGIATFVDLGLNAVLNQNYTVTFSSPGLTSATQVFTPAAVRIPEYPSNLSVSQISDSNVYRITFPAPSGGGSTIVNYQYSFDESTWYEFNPAYGSGTPVIYDIDLSSQVAKSAWDFYFRTVTSFGVSRSSYDIRNSSRSRVSIGAAGGMGPPVNATTRRPTVVSGSLVSGATLQNRMAFVGATPMTYEYKWQSCTSNTDLTTCVDIAGATASTFLVTTNQVDKYIRNIVTATNNLGNLTSISALTSTTVSGTDSTPPTVTLAASSATSSSATITFTVTGNEAITCSTLSTASGVDFTYSGITAITGIVQTSPTVCTITATSTATAGGGAVTSTLTAAGSFSMTDTAGNAQTTLNGSPQSTVVTVTDSTPPCDAACLAEIEAAKAAAAKALSDAAAKLVADKVAVEKAAAEAAAKVVTEKVTAAAAAKAALDITALNAAVAAKTVANAQAAAIEAATKSSVSQRSATSLALSKAAATGTNIVKTAAGTAKAAAIAKSGGANASKKVEIAIGALGSKTAAATTSIQANVIAAAANAAANAAAKELTDQAAAAKAISKIANKEVAIAAERILTEQKQVADARAEEEVAINLAQKASEERITSAIEAQKANDALVKALEEKIALAQASVMAKNITERAAIDKKIKEVTAKVADAQRIADAANTKAEFDAVAQQLAQAVATAAAQKTVTQAAKAFSVQIELIAKTTAAAKAEADASLAAKVANAAKAAAAKVPAKAVIAAKPSTSTNKNSATATISGLKPGQKVKVTVNVRPRP
jgi:hypothetical protein